LKKRVYRTKEVHLTDDKQTQSSDRFVDGERIVSVSERYSEFSIRPKREYHISHQQNMIFDYHYAVPVLGVYCLSQYVAPERFSEDYKDGEGIDLEWDQENAKLTFLYGEKPKRKTVLWLSRAHAWHPIRLQTFLNLDDKVYFSEWEVTKFVDRGKKWRV